MSKISESRLNILENILTSENKKINDKINDLYNIINNTNLSAGLNNKQQDIEKNTSITLNLLSKNNKFIEKAIFIPADFFIKYCYIQQDEKTNTDHLKIYASIDNKKYQLLEKTNKLILQEYKWSVNFPSENKKGFLLDFSTEEKISDNIRLFIILEKTQRF